ncbi:unnamed protein product [Mytilus coruscus]|uniref:C-type lectin domain-containing protein n=1 Tax=Mytilus coruscus TaxID=42192 RepID=A0A6J8BJ50_MYTCO|nr:unnamed protein product [Mytilus coruscus]
MCQNVTPWPCLSNESKKNFDDSRIALKDMETHLGNTVKKIENGFKKITASIQDQLGVVKAALSNVGEKVKKVDSDFQVLGKDFQNIVYWIGLTDLNEGEFRWSFDQTKATLLPWARNYGKKGNGYDCVAFNTDSKAEWFDYICNNKYYYICESNFCEYNVIIYLFKFKHSMPDHLFDFKRWCKCIEYFCSTRVMSTV